MEDVLPTIPRGAFSYRHDATIPPFRDDRPLIVFDGYCGLCSRVVQFTLQHDRTGQYRFLPAQTPLGDALYRHYGLSTTSYETFILLRGGQAQLGSDAAIDLLRTLGFPWSLAPALRPLPQRFRDRLYLWVAHNRMRIFGRTEACMLPPADATDRFLDGQAEKARQA